MSNGQARIDYTSKDYASLRAALLELATEKLPEWTDQSPNDLGVMLLELFAYMGDSLFYNQDRIAGESFLETAVERRSIVNLLRLIGYELRPPVSASADLMLLFKATATGSIVITTGTAFTTAAAVTGTPIGFQFIQPPLSIDRTSLPLCIVDSKGAIVLAPLAPPASPTTFKLYGPLPVVQVDARAIAGEIVASSDGSAGQRHALARSPVVDSTLVVRVDEGAGAKVWTRVPSLLESLGTDEVYVVRRDENDVVWIELGDGTYGKAPRRGTNNITADYCVGGGAKGNVPANAIYKAVTSIDQLKLVLHALPASGGADAEGSAEAALRGPLQFRSMGRAVTASDYQVLARAFGVAKVLALPAGWNTVQLIVAPAGGGLPSDTLVQDLQAYLEPKRMLTSLVEIVGPTYVAVHIDASVTIAPQFSTSLVQQQVVSAVAALLAFDNVDFKAPLYISKVYEVIQEIVGVVFVNITTFARGPIFGSTPSLPVTGQLTFGVDDPGELPVWQGFDGVTSTLTVQGGRSQ